VTANSNWDKAGFNGTDGVTITAVVRADGNSFTLEGVHSSLPGKKYSYDSETGKTVESAVGTGTTN
jgi:hypothetical protein